MADNGLRVDQELSDLITAAAERGARVASICTGAFALAKAGVPRRAPRDDALGLRRPAQPSIRTSTSTRTRSVSRTAQCSPRPALPLVSTYASASSAATTASRSPTSPRGGWWSHRTGRASGRSFIERPVSAMEGRGLDATRA
jgi:hypothetical protein